MQHGRNRHARNGKAGDLPVAEAADDPMSRICIARRQASLAGSIRQDTAVLAWCPLRKSYRKRGPETGRGPRDGADRSVSHPLGDPGGGLAE